MEDKVLKVLQVSDKLEQWGIFEYAVTPSQSQIDRAKEVLDIKDFHTTYRGVDFYLQAAFYEGSFLGAKMWNDDRETNLSLEEYNKYKQRF